VFVVFQLSKGIDPNKILENRSQNMVGFYYMCFVICYYWEEIKLGKNRFSLIPVCSNLFLSLLLFGRSSILISALFVLLVIYVNLRYSNQINRYKQILLILLAVFFIAGYFYSGFSAFIHTGLKRFEDQGTDITGRSEIWEAYVYHFKYSLKNMFFGVRLDADPEFIRYDGNLHNSYLIAHSFFGLFCLYIFYRIIKAISFKGDKLFCSSILLLILVRGSTDGLFFVNYNDYLLFTLVFVLYPLKIKKLSI